MRLISVLGGSPGIGKSTLCTALAAHLRGTGATVDHFEEADLFQRPAFAAVAADFTNTGTVAPDVLVDAAITYLRDAADAGVDVIVADALMPYVPSLLAFGHTEADIGDIVAGLAARMIDVETLAVFLDGDPATALRRAADRESDPGWLDWYGDKLTRYALVPVPPTLADLCTYLVRERDVTLRVLESTSWHLLVVPDVTELSAVEVLAYVRKRVML
jgi:hypothetical protein